MARTARRSAKKDMMHTAFTRFMLVVAGLVLWIGGISVRLVHLQVSQSGWLKDKAQDQRQDEKSTKMLRGNILDRDGRPLAMSVRVKTLFADGKEIEDVEATARDVSKALKLDQAEVLNTLKEGKANGKRFIPLVKKVDNETAQKYNKVLAVDKIRKADLPQYPGLHWKDDQKRSYPQQTLASHIIGFSDNDDIGRSGIEKSQDEKLHGAIIKKVQERDRLGRVYDETLTDTNRELPRDVMLTISSSIQFKVEQALENGVKAANAKSGMAVVLDPRTGEVLALANYPTFDPNKISDGGSANMANAAIQSIYSPGSVFKLVTYGGALERNLISPESEIDCGNGVIEVAKHKFKDSHHVGRVSYSQAMAHSSNVAAIKTGMQVGKEDFYNFARSFGFGKATGIELPGETNGILRPVNKWNGDSLASMSIGYEISVTALQMASAFATIANDGVKIQPHIVKEIRQSNDQKNPPAEIAKTQIISPQSAAGLRKMLRQVVLTGTGKRAQLDGYSSAGKTGTAWKYDEKLKKVNEAKYISSFIGLAPAEDTGVVIAVVIDEPQGGARDGGQVAAPVFRAIAQDILPELNIKPDSGNVDRETLIAEDIPEAMPVDEKLKTADGDTKKSEKDKTLKSVVEKPEKSSEKEDKKKADKENPKKPGDDKKSATTAKPVDKGKGKQGKDKKT